MQIILKTLAKLIRVTAAMEIKYKVKESYYNETKSKEISIKSCMDREEREVGVNSVGDGQDREWVED